MALLTLYPDTHFVSRLGPHVGNLSSLAVQDMSGTSTTPEVDYIRFQLVSYNSTDDNGEPIIARGHLSLFQFQPLPSNFDVNLIKDVNMRVNWYGPSIRVSQWIWKFYQNTGDRMGSGRYLKSEVPRSQNSGKSAQVYSWVYYEHKLLANFSPLELFNANGIMQMSVTARSNPYTPGEGPQDFLMDVAALDIYYNTY
eukprot:TRINITY_DN16541_c0_g1_i1.p1 TRINITY_DN16541_c0_g1~~TRINITY_DN16541_c0_g1_i1.p1  ORF type:complete len:197 (+),score=20.07 TRINITY_DN16541_c0_g1_i1:663-1253(+)